MSQIEIIYMLFLGIVGLLLIVAIIANRNQENKHQASLKSILEERIEWLEMVIESYEEEKKYSDEIQIRVLNSCIKNAEKEIEELKRKIKNGK